MIRRSGRQSGMIRPQPPPFSSVKSTHGRASLPTLSSAAAIADERHFHWSSAVPAFLANRASPPIPLEKVLAPQESPPARKPAATALLPIPKSPSTCPPQDPPAILESLQQSTKYRHLLFPNRTASPQVVVAPLPPRLPRIRVATVQILAGADRAPFVIPTPLLLESGSSMFAVWLRNAPSFMEGQDRGSGIHDAVLALPTVPADVFSVLLDHLAAARRRTTADAWVPPLNRVLEVAAAAHYLDLQEVVDVCVTLAALYLHHIDAFGPLLPKSVVRAILRAAPNAESLAYGERAARDGGSDSSDGPSAFDIPWLGCLARTIPDPALLCSGDDSGGQLDALAAFLGAGSRGVRGARQWVLRATPMSRRCSVWVGKERELEAVRFHGPVTDDDTQWVMRWAAVAHGGRPVHLHLVRTPWPENPVPTPATVARVSQLDTDVTASTPFECTANPVDAVDDKAKSNNDAFTHASPKPPLPPLLVRCDACTWPAIPPGLAASSHLPFQKWPIAHLTIDTIPLSPLTLSLLLRWLALPSTQDTLARLTVVRSLNTLDALASVLSTVGGTLSAVELAGNVIQQDATDRMPRVVHRLARALARCTVPAIRIADTKLPASTLAALLAGWPSNTATRFEVDGLGLGVLFSPATLFRSLSPDGPSRWPRLTHVNVARNKLLARTLIDLVAVLAEDAFRYRIRAVDLSGNQITDAVISAAAAATGSHWASLEKLALDLPNTTAGTEYEPGDPWVSVETSSSSWAQFFSTLSTRTTNSTLLVSMRGHPAATSELHPLVACCRATSVVLAVDPLPSADRTRKLKSEVRRITAHPVVIWTVPVLSNGVHVK
ncbi:hypothetical protein BC828DRAFT_392522, partial [Blastocladiella britannica]